MKTVKDYYVIAFRTWFAEILFVSKAGYTAADMADLAISMILEGRF